MNRRSPSAPLLAAASLMLLACAASLPGETPGRGAVPQPASAAAVGGQRVFVCAHSFMIFTAKLLPPMAQAAGIAHVSAGQQMLGGSRVLQHWNLPDEKNVAKKALNEGRVDVITLSPHMLLPDEGIDNFTKLGLEHNPNLRVLVQASWPARDGTLRNDFKNEQRDHFTKEGLELMRTNHNTLWRARLEDQVKALNTAAGRDAVHIIPVSEAVITLREMVLENKVPGVTSQSSLFRDPLGHPQEIIALLVTYCHFACIYQRSPEGLPVPEPLRKFPQAEELNRVLQKLAWDTVVSYPMSGVKAGMEKRS